MSVAGTVHMPPPPVHVPRCFSCGSRTHRVQTCPRPHPLYNKSRPRELVAKMARHELPYPD
jgi:hypothetical protein